MNGWSSMGGDGWGDQPAWVYEITWEWEPQPGQRYPGDPGRRKAVHTPVYEASGNNESSTRGGSSAAYGGTPAQHDETRAPQGGYSRPGQAPQHQDRPATTPRREEPLWNRPAASLPEQRAEEQRSRTAPDQRRSAPVYGRQAESPPSHQYQQRDGSPRPPQFRSGGQVPVTPGNPQPANPQSPGPRSVPVNPGHVQPGTYPTAGRGSSAPVSPGHPGSAPGRPGASPQVSGSARPVSPGHPPHRPGSAAGRPEGSGSHQPVSPAAPGVYGAARPATPGPYYGRRHSPDEQRDDQRQREGRPADGPGPVSPAAGVYGSARPAPADAFPSRPGARPAPGQRDGRDDAPFDLRPAPPERGTTPAEARPAPQPTRVTPSRPAPPAPAYPTVPGQPASSPGSAPAAGHYDPTATQPVNAPHRPQNVPAQPTSAQPVPPHAQQPPAAQPASPYPAQPPAARPVSSYPAQPSAAQPYSAQPSPDQQESRYPAPRPVSPHPAQPPAAQPVSPYPPQPSAVQPVSPHPQPSPDQAASRYPAQSTAAEPYPAQPTAAQPYPAQPTAAQPYPAQPTGAQPVSPYSPQPSAAQPVSPYQAQPSAGQPASPYPAGPVAEHVASRPVSAQPTVHTQQSGPAQPSAPHQTPAQPPVPHQAAAPPSSPHQAAAPQMSSAQPTSAQPDRPIAGGEEQPAAEAPRSGSIWNRPAAEPAPQPASAPPAPTAGDDEPHGLGWLLSQSGLGAVTPLPPPIPQPIAEPPAAQPVAIEPAVAPISPAPVSSQPAFSELTDVEPVAETPVAEPEAPTADEARPVSAVPERQDWFVPSGALPLVVPKSTPDLSTGDTDAAPGDAETTSAPQYADLPYTDYDEPLAVQSIPGAPPEPEQREQTPVRPVSAEPAQVEPVSAPPSAWQPDPHDEAQVHPASVDPVSAQPFPAEPVSAQPNAWQPATHEQEQEQPASADPVSAQPNWSEPTPAAPSSAQPSWSEPTPPAPTSTQPNWSEPALTESESHAEQTDQHEGDEAQPVPVRPDSAQPDWTRHAVEPATEIPHEEWAAEQVSDEQHTYADSLPDHSDPVEPVSAQPFLAQPVSAQPDVTDSRQSDADALNEGNNSTPEPSTVRPDVTEIRSTRSEAADDEPSVVDEQTAGEPTQTVDAHYWADDHRPAAEFHAEPVDDDVEPVEAELLEFETSAGERVIVHAYRAAASSADDIVDAEVIDDTPREAVAALEAPTPAPAIAAEPPAPADDHDTDPADAEPDDAEPEDAEAAHAEPALELREQPQPEPDPAKADAPIEATPPVETAETDEADRPAEDTASAENEPPLETDAPVEDESRLETDVTRESGTPVEDAPATDENENGSDEELAKAAEGDADEAREPGSPAYGKKAEADDAPQPPPVAPAEPIRQRREQRADARNRRTDPEQILAAYPVTYDPRTLREQIEDDDAMWVVIDRLTDKLEYAERDTDRARLLSLRAVASRLLGDLDPALEDARAALVHAEAAGDLVRTATVRARLAHVLHWRAEFAEADKIYAEAGSAELPARLRAEIHELAGRSAFEQGRYLEAVNHLERALDLRKGADPDLVERIELALDTITGRTTEGWGPYPRSREEILGRSEPARPVRDETSGLWGYPGVLSPRFAQAQPFADGVAWVRRPEAPAWELIDLSGTPLIDASSGYRAAGRFADGLAWVSRDDAGGWFAVDRQNRVIVPGGFEDARPFHNGLALVRRGGWGAVDQHGRIVVQPHYRAFATMLSSGEPVDGFTEEGLAVVDAGELYGVIDRAGHLLVQPTHAALLIHPAAFLVADKFGLWGALNRAGEPLVELKYRDRADVLEKIDELATDLRPVL